MGDGFMYLGVCFSCGRMWLDLGLLAAVFAQLAVADVSGVNQILSLFPSPCISNNINYKAVLKTL